MTFLSDLLLWSGAEAALALFATLLSNCADDKKDGEKTPLLRVLLQVVPTALLYNFIIFYFVQPSQEGFLFGQGWTLFFAALFFLGWLPLSRSIKSKDLDTIWVCFLILIALEFLLWCGTAVSVYAGAGNAERFASLANVEIASSDQKLPEPDERHRMLVTPSIARYLGQQAINSVPGNLGSLFMVRPEEWVRQSIQGHLWYAAPLEYANPLSQFGIFSQKISASPGFVLVDAENPNAEAKVVSSSPLRYLPGAYFQQNLFRHIYQHGYTMIDYPSLEVDDELHPHFTAAVLTPRFGVAGTMVKKIIVVDATTGDISEYEPGAAPAWLDRVFSANLVYELVNQWGLWSAPQSRAHWPNWAGQYQMVPEDPELVYNASDIPVWLLPMRSRQSTNASSTGVMLFDTRDNKGIFYPGLSGLGVGENVIHTFQNASSNIRAYPVDTVQLYTINSVPTWVAVYTQQQGEHGESLRQSVFSMLVT